MARFGSDMFERMSPGFGDRKQESYTNFTRQTAASIATSANQQANAPMVQLPKDNENAIGQCSVVKSNEKLTPDRVKMRLAIFKARLVDYLRNLIKPSWEAGLISKSSHKIIIKKAAEKVIQSFGETAFPPKEKIDHYLEFSHSKLSNLIEAYVQKYQGRST